MEQFEDIIRQATERLKVDAEIQMDVAHELRSHLEEAAEEFAAAGESPAQAAASAAKALGDPQELAQLLWQANRKRIALRRAAKWTSRALLLPTAAAVLVIIATGIIVPMPLFTKMLGVQGEPYFIRAEGLTEDQSLLLYGKGDQTSADHYRRIVERWPDSPVYQALYASALTSQLLNSLRNDDSLRDQRARGSMSSTDTSQPATSSPVTQHAAFATPDEIARWQAAIDRGQALEGDNTLYDMLKASVLFRMSVHVEDDPNSYPAYPEHNDLAYEVAANNPWGVKRHCFHATIRDQAVFSQAVEAFEHAAAKPNYNSHIMDFNRERLAILPRPKTFAQLVPWTQADWSSWPEGSWICQNLIRVAGSAAIVLAQSGQAAQAEQLVRTAVTASTRLGAQARNAETLDRAQVCLSETLGCAQNVYQILGKQIQAENAKQRLKLPWVPLFTYTYWDTTDAVNLSKRTSLLRAGDGRVQIGQEAEFDPLRVAEYALAQRILLVGVMALVLSLAVAFGLIAMVGVIRTRGKADVPRLLFIGWGRLGKILLLSAVLPMGIYAAYSVSPWGGREYGIAYSIGRLIVEWTVLTMIILLLLLTLTMRAIRQRAREAGMTLPPPGSKVALALLAVVGISLPILWYFSVWPEVAHLAAGNQRVADIGTVHVGILFFVAVLAVWGLAGFIRLCLLRGRYAQFRRTFYRSAVPVLAAAVIVVSLGAGLLLLHQESHAVGKIVNAAAVGSDNEESQSANFRLLRERFREEANSGERPATRESGNNNSQ